ncbi:MAG: phosphoribosylanthranilate isomerase [Candidatus Omnitrophota bacterium]
MTKVKICGITNLEDALKVADFAPDAMGFVFYKKSPRYITPLKAYGIIRQLPVDILKVGVFVDASEKDVRRTAKLCNLDMLQFHGKESPKFCDKFAERKVIKAFRIRNNVKKEDILKYNTFAYLFDAFVKSKPGGTGKRFNWKLIKKLGDLKRPIFLGGGLNEKNVSKAIELIGPEWVDVSSSVEIRPGKKNCDKVRRFIGAARSAYVAG